MKETRTTSDTDSRGTISVKSSRWWSRVALWTASGVALAGMEHLIPSPVPWVKLGLANSAALVALYTIGIPAAISVNLLRVIVISLLFQTYTSPAFLLSFSGAIISVCVMSVLFAVFGNRISPIGVSVVGAWSHMVVQFIVVSVVLVHDNSLFVMAGPSLLAAIASGIVIGWLCSMIIRRLPGTLLA